MKTNKIKTLLQGMVMGIAEILPGVSGSTFALIMGIYDNFINFLHDVSDIGKAKIQFFLGKKSFKDVLDTAKKVNWKFGALLGAGMLISIAVLSNIVGGLLEEYPQYVSAFFFGLVLASVSIPWKEMKVRQVKQFLIMMLVAVITFALLSLNPLATNNNPSLIALFFGGIVGISGMVLPGISGSFILLLLGMYEYVITIVKDITRLQATGEQLIGLAVFGAGLIFGFIVFVRFLKKGLDKFPNELMAALIGLMIGSLRALYPFYSIDSVNEDIHIITYIFDDSPLDIGIKIGLALGAIALVYVLNRTTDRKQFDKIAE